MNIHRVLIGSLVLGLLGVAVGAYLIRVHYDIGALICGNGDCEIVQTSSYATLMDIPIAIFGTAMYLTIVALTAIRLSLPRFALPASTAALAITGAGTLYSAWLTWIEIYQIEAICQWCVASAIITTTLFVLEIVVFWKLWSEEPDDVDFET